MHSCNEEDDNGDECVEAEKTHTENGNIMPIPCKTYTHAMFIWAQIAFIITNLRQIKYVFIGFVFVVHRHSFLNIVVFLFFFAAVVFFISMQPAGIEHEWVCVTEWACIAFLWLTADCCEILRFDIFDLCNCLLSNGMVWQHERGVAPHNRHQEECERIPDDFFSFPKCIWFSRSNNSVGYALRQTFSALRVAFSGNFTEFVLWSLLYVRNVIQMTYRIISFGSKLRYFLLFH